MSCKADMDKSTALHVVKNLVVVEIKLKVVY
jgi:hypothetical protein